MKVNYDPERDVMYVQFAHDLKKSAKTVTISPGVMADFDSGGKLIGIEILEAHEMVDQKVEFSLPDLKYSSSASHA